MTITGSGTREMPPEPEIDWYFTFGQGQPHFGSYVVIHGTMESARAEMVRRYGRRWGMQYHTPDMAGITRWNLTRLEST